MTAMVETNPDYSRQMYEPQFNSQYRPPDPPVVTSGLVSESDIRHQERQERLKYELSKEYHDHMQKPSDGFYSDEAPLYNPEKDEQARQRREEMMQRRSPPRQPPQSDLYDHNQMAQHLKEERRREYNDYLRRQEASELNPQRKPPTPLGGLPVGAYEEQRKRLQAERTREYRDSLLKRLSSPPHQANIGKDDYSEYRRKVERDHRNSEYNQFLARKQMEDDARKQKINEVRRQPAAPVVKGDYYDAESYDLKRQYLMEEKHREYQNYLKKKAQSAGRSPTPTNLGLPLSQNEYDTRRKHMERERNKEYNALLAKKQDDLQPRRPYNPNGPENRIGFMANLGTSLDRQREALAHQRHEEYNSFLKDRYALHGKPQGRPSWVDRQVLPDSWYKPSVQRNQDRSSQPKEDRPPPVDDRPASQRRSGTHQSYDDMLQEKRRQEANYRRDDYQDYSRPGDRY